MIEANARPYIGLLVPRTDGALPGPERRPVPSADYPTDGIALVYDADPLCATPALRLVRAPGEPPDPGTSTVILWVAASTLDEIGLETARASTTASFHLSSSIKNVIMALRECAMRGEARAIYRKAKALELLCETVRSFAGRDLVPLGPSCGLSADDVRRLMTAKRMVDDRPTEKLTLDRIARACGLNRAKLTRGFRELFDCSIAEALGERRLDHARRLLLTTDMPISVISYQSGYQSNSSFSRAFGRCFGAPPSNLRSVAAAA